MPYVGRNYGKVGGLIGARANRDFRGWVSWGEGAVLIGMFVYYLYCFSGMVLF